MSTMNYINFQSVTTLVENGNVKIIFIYPENKIIYYTIDTNDGLQATLSMGLLGQIYIYYSG